MKLLKKQTIVISIAILAILFAILAFIPSKEAFATEEETSTVSSEINKAINVTDEMENLFTGLHYIENANYFITNPLHGKNDGTDNSQGTCTTVAVQMLMGYHNYYTDRRLIPATDENGEPFLTSDYGNLEQHPDIDTHISVDNDYLGRGSTGTHDNFYRKLLDFNFISAVPGIGQNYESVLKGTNKFVQKYAASIAQNVTVNDWSEFNDTSVRAELDNGNPIIVGCAGFDEMKFHVMVAYGYATYEGEEGYIVHKGYYSDETKCWIPTRLLVYQAKVTVRHTHTFEDGEYFNSYYKEIVCTTCGANTLETIFTTNSDRNSITGLRYPFINNTVILPNSVMRGSSSGKMIKENITYIDNEAFVGVMAGETTYSVTVSNGIKDIGTRAFKNCSSLSSIQLGSSVESIGVEAFKGCSILENVYTYSSTPKYTSVNGVLYSADKSVLLFYPYGKKLTSFVVDSACRELASYAIADNTTLSSLNMVNTKTINDYSIANCPSLVNITAPNLEWAYSSAITETKFTDEAENITLGKVIYRKTSSGETVEIGEDIQAIAPNAFIGNTSIKKVVITDGNFKKIGDNAFKDCSTLENIEIYNLNEVANLGTGALDGVSANLKIKVPQKYLNTYKTETTKGWTSFVNNLSTFDKLSVKYVVDDKIVKESLVDYGNEIGEDYRYVKDNYNAITWENGNGAIINKSFIVKNDIVLYGELVPYKYTIIYDTQGGDLLGSDEYDINEDEELLTPTRAGYTFKGWHTSLDFSEENNIGTMIRKGTLTGNLTLYAEWEVNTYIVSLKMFENSGVVERVRVVFDKPFTFNIVSADWRIFNGWKDENGRLLTNANGVSLAKWNIPKDIIVYADWILVEYTITYVNIEGTSLTSQKITIEDLDFVLPTPTREGGRFEGWYTERKLTISSKIEKISTLENITVYAKWAHLCNISFNPGDGAIYGYGEGEVVKQTAYTGDEIYLYKPSYPGMKSGSWKCSFDGRSYSFDKKITIPGNNDFITSEDWVFTAEWVPNTYIITFDFDGGYSGEKKATESVVATFGETVPEIVPPVKDGYIFAQYRAEGKSMYYYTSNFKIERGTYLFDHDVTLKADWVSPYPELTIKGKIGNVWQIEIKNNTNLRLSFVYNEKMCYERDAKAWSGLKNQKEVSIGMFRSTTVDIHENFFATCIAVSVKIDDTRYITYAYNLDANTKTLTPVNCYVSA